MTPLLAAIVAVAWLATPIACSAWLGTGKPAHVRRLLSHGALLVDVGTPDEYAEGHFTRAVSVPSTDLALRQNELGDHRRPIVTYARSRMRSAVAAQTLRGIGFHEVFDMGTPARVRSLDAGVWVGKG